MISVIVTVYNKEPYIRRCIESIEENTYKDIEIIIVEDCSTDNSMKVIEELMSEHNNITLIKNEVNRGAGYSRNVGIKAAKGEWISLIDSDDWIDEDYFQTYLDRVEDDVDIIFGECKNVQNLNYYNGFTRDNENILSVTEDIIIKLNEYKLQFLNLSLIKRTLFDNIEYCKERLIEDTPTAYLLLFNSKKIQFIKYNGYNYIQLSSSLIHSSSHLIKSLHFIYNMIDVIHYIALYNKNLGNNLKKQMLRFLYRLFPLYQVTIQQIFNIFNKEKIQSIIDFYNVDFSHVENILKNKSKSKISYIKYEKLKNYNNIIFLKDNFYYVDIAKNGSSTLRNLKYYYENNKKWNDVHNKLWEFYSNIDNFEEFKKYKNNRLLIILRDPVERIISYYLNCKNSGKLQNFHLRKFKDIISYLELQKNENFNDPHTRPQYLAYEEYKDYITDVIMLDELTDFLKNEVNVETVDIINANHDLYDQYKHEFTEDILQYIREFYREDYKIINLLNK